MSRVLHQLMALIIAALLGTGTALALDVNRASVDELQNVSGVGPVIAKRIASERRKSKFKSMADLQARVPGVGPQIAANLNKGSGLPKGKAGSKARKSAVGSSKTAKARITEFADKRKPKSKGTKQVKAKKASTKKLAKKVSNNKN